MNAPDRFGELSAYFSPDYTTARNRFRESAAAAAATSESLTLDARTPEGDVATIDIAWLGSRNPRRVLLHSSGLHGVEGFAGSAIQLKALRERPVVSPDGALVFVHALNPYGMAWLRRTNENNVDLNRNFLSRGDSWSGVAAAYRLLNPLLNPKTAPSKDFFYVRAMLKILRYGFQYLKQAVAGGQYEFPQGLFYGGRCLEQGPRLYRSWLADNLSTAEYLFAIDVHTGLGHWGRESLIAEGGKLATPRVRLTLELNKQIIVNQDSSVGYVIRGGLGEMLREVFARAKLDYVIQEFGTVSALRILHTMREENRWHRYGGGGLDHPAKHQMREAFFPTSRPWRYSILNKGTARLERAAAFAFV